MKSLLLGSGMAIALLVPTLSFAQTAPDAGPRAVGTTLEMHISNNGTALVRGAKITSISGTTVNATQTWGSYSVNWIIDTTASTELLRRYGAASSLSEFAVGDYVSFSGPVDTTQTNLTVNATVLRDFSIQKRNATFGGSVVSLNPAAMSFVLASHDRGNITVVTSANSVIMQGSASSTFASLAVGQTISEATGVWDTVSNTLQATRVRIAVSQGLLNKRTFEGTLNTLPGASAPTTFTFTVGSTLFTVNVAANTQLLSNGWNPMQLSQMQANDKVRVYGAVEANSTSTIDSYIVRDTAVK